MRRQFKELDYQETPIGVLSLRRRHEPLVGQDIYEVKLDDDFLSPGLSEIAGRRKERAG